MKTITQYLRFVFLIIVATGLNTSYSQDQPKPLAAVLGIDSKGVIQDPESVGFMVRLELEKVNVYSLMDRYDVADGVKKNNIDLKTCFGKTCVVAAGKALKVDKVITGSVERFGEKIVIVLKVIDVKTENVEKQDATEYLNLQPELQRMIEISVKKMLGLAVNQATVELLVNYETPIESPQTRVRLNGPRMGASMAFGEAGDIMKASKDVGGFDMFPAMFQFGWQQEWQYLSAGNFQALIEFIGLIGGLESSQFIPSFTFLNGFRFGKQGWEFAFGPSFRFVKKADGYYDPNNGDNWVLKEDWNSLHPGISPPVLESRLDSRGTTVLSTSLLLAAGKTFKSGYLNIPVNLYVSPRLDGTIVGFSFGFNIYKKPKVQ